MLRFCSKALILLLSRTKIDSLCTPEPTADATPADEPDAWCCVLLSMVASRLVSDEAAAINSWLLALARGELAMEEQTQTGHQGQL